MINDYVQCEAEFLPWSKLQVSNLSNNFAAESRLCEAKYVGHVTPASFNYFQGQSIVQLLLVGVARNASIEDLNIIIDRVEGINQNWADKVNAKVAKKAQLDEANAAVEKATKELAALKEDGEKAKKTIIQLKQLGRRLKEQNVAITIEKDDLKKAVEMAQAAATTASATNREKEKEIAQLQVRFSLTGKVVIVMT